MAGYRSIARGRGIGRKEEQAAIAWGKDGHSVTLSSVRHFQAAIRFGSKNYPEGPLGPVLGWCVTVESPEGYLVDAECSDHRTEEEARRAANQAVLRHGGLAAAQGAIRPTGAPRRPERAP